jgi:hypothetical protein
MLLPVLSRIIAYGSLQVPCSLEQPSHREGKEDTRRVPETRRTGHRRPTHQSPPHHAPKRLPQREQLHRRLHLTLYDTPRLPIHGHGRGRSPGETKVEQHDEIGSTVQSLIMHCVGRSQNPMHYESYAIWACDIWLTSGHSLGHREHQGLVLALQQGLYAKHERKTQD